MRSILSILGLMVLTIAGCARPIPSISVTNDSKSRLNVVSLKTVEHFKRTELMPGQTESVVSRPVFIQGDLTIVWYTVGAPKSLPAIKEDVVSMPQDWDGIAPLKLSFDADRKWSASF